MWSTNNKYVDVLTEKVSHLAVGNYSSKHVLVFSSVVLQRDYMIRKGSDVHYLLEQCLTLWRQESFNLLIQEATRCNKANLTLSS